MTIEKQKDLLARKASNDLEKRKKKRNILAMGNEEQNNAEVFENFEEDDKDVQMTSKDITFIINSLKDNFIFANLKETEFDMIISNMFSGTVK